MLLDIILVQTFLIFMDYNLILLLWLQYKILEVLITSKNEITKHHEKVTWTICLSNK